MILDLDFARKYLLKPVRVFDKKTDKLLFDRAIVTGVCAGCSMNFFMCLMILPDKPGDGLYGIVDTILWNPHIFVEGHRNRCTAPAFISRITYSNNSCYFTIGNKTLENLKLKSRSKRSPYYMEFRRKFPNCDFQKEKNLTLKSIKEEKFCECICAKIANS